MNSHQHETCKIVKKSWLFGSQMHLHNYFTQENNQKHMLFYSLSSFLLYFLSFLSRTEIFCMCMCVCLCVDLCHWLLYECTCAYVKKKIQWLKLCSRPRWNLGCILPFIAKCLKSTPMSASSPSCRQSSLEGSRWSPEFFDPCCTTQTPG